MGNIVDSITLWRLGYFKAREERLIATLLEGLDFLMAAKPYLIFEVVECPDVVALTLGTSADPSS